MKIDKTMRFLQFVVVMAGSLRATASESCTSPLCQSCTYNRRLCDQCPQQSSDQICNGQGVLQCGVCICNDGYFGDECEGSTTDIRCMQPNSSVVCSTRGTCIAGECLCHSRRTNSMEIYSGEFCECDDYSCNYYGDKICGGPNRGICMCGKCMCNNDYTGDACECATSASTCLASNGKLCNGHGECECGRCKCDSGPNYSGPTCEDCPWC